MTISRVTLDPRQDHAPQITAQLRTLLADGCLAEGARLPSTEQLARLWHSNVPYVHAGLKPLVQEGWLERRQGSGTFVRNRPRALRTVGLYHYGSLEANPELRFVRAVHHALIQQIEQYGWRWTSWNDSRPASATGPWPELETAIRRRELDALVVPATDRTHYSWVSKLPVPTAFMGPANIADNMVATDLPQLARLGVTELARQGCRTVGLISAWRKRRRPDSDSDEDTAVYRTFAALTRGEAPHTQPSWIVTPDQLRPKDGWSHERWGYEAFRRLWSQAEHPDGLLVATDAEALGVTMAILELGLKVPKDLRVVYHKNAGVDLLCPFPVTHIVSRPQEYATALLKQVQRQVAGESVHPLIVGHSVQFAAENGMAVT